ncbi:hypothetical protein SLA2020_231220 [Shorea laevis]
MGASEQDTVMADSSNDQSLKLAVAISLLRSKILEKQPPPSGEPSESDALRWKRKAKERKQELLRLREDLKEAEDASQCDLLTQSASCKCFFFDSLGKFSSKPDGDASDCRFNDVLRRRFLRQVRFMERKRASGSATKRHYLDFNSEDELEQLRAAVDFLVELCDTTPVKDSKFTNWSHQAVDFILVSLKNLLSMGKKTELIEGIISSLITRLVRRMSSPSTESLQAIADSPFYIQHTIRKLGSEPFIGQRAILYVSQRISALAESLLFSDPFEEAFPTMHECMFLMIQLIEFLISDYLSTWSQDEGFDNILFEEWVTSVLHARKAVELLESRNGLYVLYMDRVTGELAKLIGQVSSLHMLNPDILDNLFDMTPLKLYLAFSLITIFLFSQSPPASAHQEGRLVPSGQQPSAGTQKLAADRDMDSFGNRKLRIYMRKRIRPSGIGTRGRTSSAVRTRLSSLHVASVLGYSFFFAFPLS